MKLWMAEAAGSLALGTAAVMAGLWGIYRQIQKKSGSISEHYFNVVREHLKGTWIDKVMGSFTYGFLCFAVFFALFILSFTAARMWFWDKPEELAAVGVVQNGIHILLPILTGVTTLFATFKKPVYVLFTTRDVVKKYKLLPCLFLVTAAWALAIASQAAASLAPRAEGQVWQIIFSSFALTLLISAGAVGLVVLTNSYRIVFSGETAELELLDTLYYRMYEEEGRLRTVDCGDLKAVRVINLYLLERMGESSRRFAAELDRKGPLTWAEFWDVAEKAPSETWVQKRFQAIQLLKPILLFSAAWEILFWGLTDGVDGVPFRAALLSKYGLAVFFSSLCVLLGAGFLFVRSRPLQTMGRILAYGSWGYQFYDENGRPCFYMSRSQTWNRGAKWLRTCFNLTTLYRIELLNGFQWELLDELERMLAKAGEETEGLLLRLVYCLCARLALERSSKAEEREKLKGRMRGALGDGGKTPLFLSWSDAIWNDMRRDPAWYKMRKQREIR